MRATGLQSDASPEIIEMIDDDDTNAFGDRAPNTTGFDPGGQRWVGPVAAGVLVTLIGFGVATSASSGGAPKVAPATSTTLATNTIRAKPPTTISSLPSVPYYAADLSRQFTVQSADLQHFDSGAVAGNHYELWATPGATATTGSWFSIETDTGGTTVYGLNAYRRQSGQLSIAISHMPGGNTVTQFAPDGRFGATITSFGWSDDNLVRLAAAMKTASRTIEFSDAWFSSDHQMISSVAPRLAVYGIPAERVSYASLDDPAGGVYLSIGQRLPASEGGATLDRQIALRFLLDHTTPFGVDGHSAVAGTIVGQRDSAMATWIARDHIVTVTAAMPVSQLIAIARTVHEVSSTEWDGMKFRAIRNDVDDNGDSSNYGETQPHPVTVGADGGFEPSTIQASIATFNGQQQIHWSWGKSGVGTAVRETPQINTVVDDTLTYVLADLPRTIAPAAELHVLRDGLDPVIVPFHDIDPELDRTFAAYTFSEAVPYTAYIVGAGGAVLVTWPSP